jgi:hypothetical protein
MNEYEYISYCMYNLTVLYYIIINIYVAMKAGLYPACSTIYQKQSLYCQAKLLKFKYELY